MSEQDPERWSALDRPESEELDEAAADPGMNYGDPTEAAMSDERFEQALDAEGNVADDGSAR